MSNTCFHGGDVADLEAGTFILQPCLIELNVSTTTKPAIFANLLSWARLK